MCSVRLYETDIDILTNDALNNFNQFIHEVPDIIIKRRVCADIAHARFSYTQLQLPIFNHTDDRPIGHTNCATSIYKISNAKHKILAGNMYIRDSIGKLNYYITSPPEEICEPMDAG